MQLSNASILELLWTLIDGVGAPTAALLALDALADRRAQKKSQEDGFVVTESSLALTMTLIVLSSAVGIALFLHLLLGILALWLPPNPNAGPWSDRFAMLLIVSEFLLVAGLIYMQRVRKRVLNVETAAATLEAIRLAAELKKLKEEEAIRTEKLTVEIAKNTDATEAQTYALYNGPMASQKAHTAALTAHTEEMAIAEARQVRDDAVGQQDADERKEPEQ